MCGRFLFDYQIIPNCFFAGWNAMSWSVGNEVSPSQFTNSKLKTKKSTECYRCYRVNSKKITNYQCPKCQVWRGFPNLKLPSSTLQFQHLNTKGLSENLESRLPRPIETDRSLYKNTELENLHSITFTWWCYSAHHRLTGRDILCPKGIWWELWHILI